ncbi:MAG: flagellar filament outer layer protein FlaA [Treponema sp.]|nr:flagellar filament outer layer protein FlaA [Treponema sp.]MCL2250980.1 flagellar filament outer layer protein FlaA [Treponema sp.]
MKQISFKIICLIVLACITVFSGYGQYRAVSLETRMLETFNGDDDAPYVWKTQASRFIAAIRDDKGEIVQDNNGNTVRYPVTSYINAWPSTVFGGQPTNTIRSLGLHGAFDRRGYNWIDLYPTLADDADGNPYEIPIPGTIKNLDLWVWGANLRYYIEVYVRDYRGVIHSLKLGDISYPGWRNLNVNIPTNIPQARRTLPSYAGLTFVKFRIWTLPVERVDNFYIYFKQLKVLTDMFEPLYDGSDLADPARVDNLWSSNN